MHVEVLGGGAAHVITCVTFVAALMRGELLSTVILAAGASEASCGGRREIYRRHLFSSSIYGDHSASFPLSRALSLSLSLDRFHSLEFTSSAHDTPAMPPPMIT